MPQTGQPLQQIDPGALNGITQPKSQKLPEASKAQDQRERNPAAAAKKQKNGKSEAPDAKVEEVAARNDQAVNLNQFGLVKYKTLDEHDMKTQILKDKEKQKELEHEIESEANEASTGKEFQSYFMEMNEKAIEAINRPQPEPEKALELLKQVEEFIRKIEYSQRNMASKAKASQKYIKDDMS